ncbi:thioredoxin family protein [Echinicola jeungdonensis]|uniref:Thioredoxin family protein n=1 Tax=Echinicola jeungdonensis TaxID=709343 RepID=A0ABV5J0S6_9BACT|nr:thioredoxin family protein [Echinicola jeungdonensis]MDN3668259.1 thioredoxin family protein [Echinicola jeungdonensis]
MSTITSSISPELIDQAMNYADYRGLIDQLLEEDKTTGDNHSETMLDYTRINVQRMKRWDKTAKVGEEIKEAIQEVDSPQVWLVLTEAWCGDAAQNIPYIEKLASHNENIKIRYLLRDENPGVMDQYLTNGGRSIPKLVALEEDTLEEQFTWGPRPQVVQQKMLDYKANPESMTSEEFKKSIHLWYAKDKNSTLEKEFLSLLTNKN